MTTVRANDLTELAEAVRQPGPLLVEAAALPDGPASAAGRIEAALARSAGPTVLAVSGPVAGAGLAVALAFDVVVCTPAVTFTAGPDSSILDSGLAARLTDRVGAAWARHLALTGVPLDAAQAQRAGLVAAVSAEPVAWASGLLDRWTASSGPALVRRALIAAQRLERAESDAFSRDLLTLLATGQPG